MPSDRASRDRLGRIDGQGFHNGKDKAEARGCSAPNKLGINVLSLIGRLYAGKRAIGLRRYKSVKSGARPEASRMGARGLVQIIQRRSDCWAARRRLVRSANPLSAGTVISGPTSDIAGWVEVTPSFRKLHFLQRRRVSVVHSPPWSPEIDGCLPGPQGAEFASPTICLRDAVWPVADCSDRTVRHRRQGKMPNGLAAGLPPEDIWPARKREAPGGPAFVYGGVLWNAKFAPAGGAGKVLITPHAEDAPSLKRRLYIHVRRARTGQRGLKIESRRRSDTGHQCTAQRRLPGSFASFFLALPR